MSTIDVCNSLDWTFKTSSASRLTPWRCVPHAPRGSSVHADDPLRRLGLRRPGLFAPALRLRVPLAALRRPWFERMLSRTAASDRPRATPVKGVCASFGPECLPPSPASPLRADDAPHCSVRPPPTFRSGSRALGSASTLGASAPSPAPPKGPVAIERTRCVLASAVFNRPTTAIYAPRAPAAFHPPREAGRTGWLASRRLPSRVYTPS
jgi:hypothetical protein